MSVFISGTGLFTPKEYITTKNWLRALIVMLNFIIMKIRNISTGEMEALIS